MLFIKEIIKNIDDVKDTSKSSRLRKAFKEAANINSSNTSGIPFDNPRNTKGLEDLKKEFELSKDDVINFKIGLTRIDAVKLLNSLSHSINKKGFDAVSGENIYSKVFGRSIARFSGKNYYTISEICILSEANGTVIKI